VQLDLGAVYSVNQIKVWHYAADGRTYHKTKTQVSANGSTWGTVFDSTTSREYAETAAGKTHTFAPRNVRYVRDWLNGSTVLKTGTSGAPASLQSLTYSYDDVGNVEQIVDAKLGQTQTFEYDERDRLESATATGGSGGTYSRSWQYDEVGNITYNSSLGLFYKYSGGKPHAVTHLSAAQGGAGTQQFWYDANGNMTTRVIGGATYGQGWDAENRLTSVTVGGQTTAFTYDGDGALVKKTAGGQTTVYVGGIYEKNLATGVETWYYTLGGRRVAMRKAGVVTYLVGDHLGSTSLALNANGTLHSEARYYPYGEERWSSGTLPTDYRFTGQRLDSYINLVQMGSRWYDPALARWISLTRCAQLRLTFHSFPWRRPSLMPKHLFLLG